MTQNERTFHGPQLLTVARVGNPQFGPAWAFQGQEGFWKAPRDQGWTHQQLVKGQSYMVTWTVKPNPPHNPYRDIVSAVLPEGQVARYDPQGNMVPGPAGPVVTPEQTVDWANNPPRDYYNEADNPEYDEHIDPPQQPKRDPRHESIEKQVGVKEAGSMLQVLAANASSELFTTEQVEWLRQMWFDGLYELKHGTPPPAQAEEETA